MKKKWFYAAILLIVMSFILTFVKREGREKEEQKEVVNFELWTINEFYSSFMQQKAESYNASAIGKEIRLDIKVYTRNQIAYKLKAAFQSGNGIPDFVDINYQDFSEFIGTSNYKLNLYPLNSLREDYAHTINQEALNPFTANGILFAIPYGTGREVVFYNVKLLSEYRVDASKCKTWEDFIAMGRHIQDMGGPMLCPLDIQNNDLFLMLLLQSGVDLQILSEEELSDTEEYKELFQLILSMCTSRQIMSIPANYDIYNREFFEEFEQDSYVCIIAPLEYANELMRQLPRYNSQIVAYPLPGLYDSGTPVAVAQYATTITAQCKDISTAKEFLAYAKLEEEALYDITDTLLMQNIGSQKAVYTYTPDHVIYKEYFRGNPVKSLYQGGSKIIYFEGNQNISRITQRYVSELLEAIDAFNKNE